MTLHVLPERRLSRLADLVDRYDGRTPRYTSYPTAVQFSPTVDEATYRGWLAALPAGEAISLYLHIPFCAQLCLYCGCNTRAVRRRAPIFDYVTMLIRELDLLAQALPARLPIRAIHLGGGSPNMLTPEDLDRLFGAIGGVFDVAADAEIAAELDPSALSAAWIEAAARHGLNRASLGVQNLDRAVQAAVNRQETFEQVAEAVHRLRAVGVKSINLDLMYGLPLQTTANTLETLNAILTLAPERIALFGYAHVPWMKTHQALIDEATLPSGLDRLDQSETAAAQLRGAGYVRIGLDHFAHAQDQMAEALKTGTLRRNFQGYTTDQATTLLGVGASSIGRLPQGFVQNATPELAWRQAVEAGRLPVARGVEVSHEDRLVGEVIERLMCDLEVDLEAVRDRHGAPSEAFDAALTKLEPFFADGLATLSEAGVLRVIGDGRLLVRSIAAAFDRYLEANQPRHAKAI